MHENFPETGCAIAIKVKKCFMDEWTGGAIPEQVNALRDALAATIPAATAMRRSPPCDLWAGSGRGLAGRAQPHLLGFGDGGRNFVNGRIAVAEIQLSLRGLRRLVAVEGL